MSPSGSSLIYQVRSEDIAHSSWLVATMHVQDKRAFVHYDRVLQLMEPHLLYCSEVDLTEMENSLDKDSFRMPERESLHELLGDRKFKKFRDIALKSFSLDIGQFDQMMPMILINQLSLLVLNRDMPLPLDMALWYEAVQRDMPLGGLESVQEQKDVMAALDIGQQLKMLKGIFRNVSKFRQHTIRLVETFSHSQMHKLYQLAKKDLGGMRDILIYRRNKVMCQSFADKHRNGPLIAAVGGGHFAGEYGLISLLRKEGHEVRPVNMI